MQDFIVNGEKIIAEKIAKAKAEGKSNVVISGNYLISETVIIPTDTTIILNDCHLKLADGVKCNLFANTVCRKFENRNRETADKNIKIIGVGRAILDGGNYNGLSEKTWRENGNPHVTANCTLFFTNVDGFEIRNLKVTNQRYWAFNFTFCRYGKISDIDFCADYTRIDENGNRVVGLDRDKYGETYIKNADGIDLRIGCHDIIIENITGFTEDDSIALTAIPDDRTMSYAVENESVDIYNVTIRNIITAAYCTNVRLLNQGSSKIYNILVDNVQDTSVDKKYYVGRGVAAVRVGDTRIYGERHSYKDETFNIAIKNVYSRAACAVSLVGEMTNVKCENINGYDGCPVIIDDKNAKVY